MDSIQCAVILSKMERFDWELERREVIAQRYASLLEPFAPSVRRIRVKPDRNSVHAQYTILTAERDALAARLKAGGIPTAIHYPLGLHQQPAYAAAHAGERYPAAEEAALSVLSLPMHPDLAEPDQERIAAVIRDALRPGGAQPRAAKPAFR
jgi:UDP-2-acetamido-2-deoxy-ribo-hexuluronate aminotransferase